LVSPIQKVRNRYLQLRQSRMNFPDLHQLAGLTEWERSNENGIDDAEKSCIGSDSQRDR
jgi:hypothetical protein